MISGARGGGVGGAAAKKKSMVPIVPVHKFMCIYIYMFWCGVVQNNAEKCLCLIACMPSHIS